jgi:hypothetical protein
MFSNAPSLPPEPVHYLPKASRSIVHPALRRLEQGSQRRDVLAPPNRTQNVPRTVGPILRCRVVVDIVFCNVLESFANVLLVDKSLREGLATQFSLSLCGIGAADTGWWFDRAGLAGVKCEDVLTSSDGRRKDSDGREERGDQNCDTHVVGCIVLGL